MTLHYLYRLIRCIPDGRAACHESDVLPSLQTPSNHNHTKTTFNTEAGCTEIKNTFVTVQKLTVAKTKPLRSSLIYFARACAQPAMLPNALTNVSHIRARVRPVSPGPARSVHSTTCRVRETSKPFMAMSNSLEGKRTGNLCTAGYFRQRPLGSRKQKR